MRGQRPLSWLWDWLGGGSVGTEYEVMELVQPTIAVEPFEFPFRWQYYLQAVALAAGAVSIQLPCSQGKQRIWTTLYAYRSNIAAGDYDQLLRSASSGPNIELFSGTAVNLLTANNTVPLVGVVTRNASPAGVILEQHGRGPVMANAANPLTYTATAAAAVGQVTLAGNWFEIPENAPLPFPHLL